MELLKDCFRYCYTFLMYGDGWRVATIMVIIALMVTVWSWRSE